MWYLTKADSKKIYTNLMNARKLNEKEDQNLAKKIKKLEKEHEMKLRKLNSHFQIELKKLGITK